MLDGEKLKQLRKTHGYTQTELAELLGVTRGMVAKYESGESQMGMQVLTELCKKLNTTPNELLGFSPESDPIKGETGQGGIHLERQLLQILADQVRTKETEIEKLREENRLLRMHSGRLPDSSHNGEMHPLGGNHSVSENHFKG